MAAATADGSSSSSGGQFYPPTVIVGVTPDMDLYHEEVFGPVSASAAVVVVAP
jgi:succinate-semialdehyde dehydrogenase/glutarate-semialdehyde dehydrogenase